MDTIDDRDDERFDNDIEPQREAMRAALDEIASDIGMVMRDEGLHFPVYITVRDHGDPLATAATLLDPSGDDWSRATAIVCQIIQKKSAPTGCAGGNCSARLRTRCR
jgi:hypothetical protein